MPMLLASLPYTAAGALYWLNCADVFGRAHEDPPDAWIPRIFLPVLTAALGPLAIASASSVRDDALLLSASGIGVLFSLLVAATARGPESYYRMQLETRLGDWRLPWARRWEIVRGLGLVVIAYSGVVSVIAVR